MIDPKELRIGNLAQSPNGWIGNVTVVGPQFIMLSCPDDRHEYTFGFDLIGPILITTKWLERLGFEKRESSVCNQWWNGINDVTHDWLVDITEMKDNGEFFYRNGKFVIKTVHQLQNLYFALTGTELELAK